MRDSFLGFVAIAAVKIAHQRLFKDAITSTVEFFDEDTFFALGEMLHPQSAFIPEAE